MTLLFNCYYMGICEYQGKKRECLEEKKDCRFLNPNRKILRRKKNRKEADNGNKY